MWWPVILHFITKYKTFHSSSRLEKPSDKTPFILMIFCCHMRWIYLWMMSSQLVFCEDIFCTVSLDWDQSIQNSGIRWRVEDVWRMKKCVSRRICDNVSAHTGVHIVIKMCQWQFTYLSIHVNIWTCILCICRNKKN